MKKYILSLIAIVFAFIMTFNLSSCSKEEVEPGRDKDEVTIYGTWRHYTDKAKGYYRQITLEEDGTLIWREFDSHEDETAYSTYIYEDRYITWYQSDNDIEAIWYVVKLEKSTMVTYDVDEGTGEFEFQEIWTRVE